MDFAHHLVICNEYITEIRYISILCWNGKEVSTQLRPTERAVHSNWNTVPFSDNYTINTVHKPSIPKYKTWLES